MSLVAVRGAVAIAIVLLGGCGGRESPDEPVESTLLYFEPLGYGQRASLSDTTTLAVRDEDTWRIYQDSLAPVAPFEPVDFSQAIVLLAALPQTASGYSIEFVSVEERDSLTVAEFVVGVPGNDCLTALASTVPFQAILVRRTDLPVEFKWRSQEYRCTSGRLR